MMTSWAHCIAYKEKYVALVSTQVETNNPQKGEWTKMSSSLSFLFYSEIESALRLLGPIEQMFTTVSEIFDCVDYRDNIFVSSSYDASSHFESTANEVMSL
jgi:Rab GDP dissociation inhibitor